MCGTRTGHALYFIKIMEREDLLLYFFSFYILMMQYQDLWYVADN